MQEKNTSLIHLLLWSVQDLASSNAWEVSAQAEPEAWVMFFLTSCVNISSFQTDLVVFPGTETVLKACRRFLYQPSPWTANALWKGTRTFSEADGTWRTLSCSHRDFYKDRAVTEFPLCLSWSLLIFFFFFQDYLCANSQFVMPDLFPYQQLLWCCHLQSKLCSIPWQNPAEG